MDGTGFSTDFKLACLARLFSSLATQMASVFVGWQLYQLHGSILELGWLGLAQALPLLLFSPLSPGLLERLGPNRIITACLTLQLAIMLCLLRAVMVTELSVPMILGGAFLIALGRVFQIPAQQIQLHHLAPSNQLSAAIALNASSAQLAIIGGPVLAGFIYLQGAPALCSGTLLLTTIALACIAGLSPQKRPAPEPEKRTGLLAGFRCIRHDRNLFRLLLADSFNLLLGGATALFPVYAKDILDCGELGLGLLRSAPPLGALLLCLYLVRYPIKGPGLVRHRLAMMLSGVGICAFACSEWLPLSLLALVVSGAGMAFCRQVHQSVLLQTPIPVARNSLVSADSLLSNASQQLGEFESGITAAYLGPIPACLLGGMQSIVVALSLRPSRPVCGSS